MREIGAEYGQVELEGAAAGGAPSRSDARALVRGLVGRPVADAEVAAKLEPLLAPFVLPGFRLTLATRVEIVPGCWQRLELTKDETSFFGEIRTADEIRVGTIARRLRLADREVRHDRLVLEPEWQGQHLGPAMLAQAQHLYAQLEMRRITITAGGSVGGSLWAHAGFDLVGKSREIAELRLADFLEALGQLAPPLPPAWRAWDICELTASDGKLRTIREIATLIAEGGGPLIDVDRAPLADHCVEPDRERPLGHALLFLLVPWSGRLDFADTVAMTRYQRFLQKGCNAEAITCR